jgi:hypothetical protein
MKLLVSACQEPEQKPCEHHAAFLLPAPPIITSCECRAGCLPSLSLHYLVSCPEWCLPGQGAGEKYCLQLPLLMFIRSHPEREHSDMESLTSGPGVHAPQNTVQELACLALFLPHTKQW